MSTFQTNQIGTNQAKTKSTSQSYVHRSLLREPHMCHDPPPRLLCIPGRFWVTVGVFHGCVGNVVLLQRLDDYRLKIILNPPFSYRAKLLSERDSTSQIDYSDDDVY